MHPSVKMDEQSHSDEGGEIHTELEQPRNDEETDNYSFHDCHTVPTEFICNIIYCVVGTLLGEFRRDIFIEHGVDGENARCNAEDKMGSEHHPIEIEQAAAPGSRSNKAR